MFKLQKFKYDINCRVFRTGLTDVSKKEDLEVDNFIGNAINETSEILKLNNNVLSQKLKDSNLQEFLRSFVCISFPPYSPYVPYDEILIENPMHTNINILSRNVFNIFLEASKCSGSETLCKLGFSDPKFILNLLNLYGKNNEKLVNEILKTCNMVNGKFDEDMISLAHSLSQILSDLYRSLRSFVDQFGDSKNKNLQDFTEIPLLADRSNGNDYTKLFVNQEHLMLDIAAFLDIVFKFTPERFYSNMLELYVESLYGKSKPEQVLTNCYYLLLYLHQLIVETKEPIYVIKNFDSDYAMRFQICVYYRCRILVLKTLLRIVKYNINKSPEESADYCYNWLLIFIKIGGEQYSIDRDLIVEDLNEINFPIYIDEWNSVHKLWSQNEISQMKSLVASVKEKNMDQNIQKIKEVTQIEDEDTIRNCLTKHQNDVDSTIIDLINNFTITGKPNKINEIGKKGVEKLSISYIPSENKQAIMNYWDFIRENDMYNDDNEEDDDIPVNVNISIDDNTPSEEPKMENSTEHGKNFYRNKQNHKAHYGNHHRRDRHRKKMQSGMFQ